jgi:hypothetical protein
MHQTMASGEAREAKVYVTNTRRKIRFRIVGNEITKCFKWVCNQMDSWKNVWEMGNCFDNGKER